MGSILVASANSFPDGRIFAIETKTWKKSPDLVGRAARLAGSLSRASLADRTLVVVKDLDRSRPARGVLNSSAALVEVLQEELSQAEARPKKDPPKLEPVVKLLFAAMPFSREYNDTYWVAMVPAAAAAGAVCRRVDKEEYVGSIVEKIEGMIEEAVGVIADLSEGRPNVLYEAGFARGLKKPTIAVCSTPLDQLPFDVRQWNTIVYSKGETNELTSPLTRRVRAVIP